MAYSKLYLLPVAVFVLVPISFLITYLVAVKLKHVDPRLPYISDTGTVSPESCLFAQFCNTYAAMTLLCIYIKYRQIQEAMRLYEKECKRLNKIALILGVLCCLGLQIVGNFQETNVLIVHGIGAALCFVSGTVYFMIQCIISHRLPELGPARWVLKLRQFMTLLCVVAMLITIIAAAISFKQYQGDLGNLPQWKPEDDGWEFHLVSSGAEWILAVTFCALILTFVPEFAKLRVEPLTVLLETEDPKCKP